MNNRKDCCGQSFFSLNGTPDDKKIESNKFDLKLKKRIKRNLLEIISMKEIQSRSCQT